MPQVEVTENKGDGLDQHTLAGQQPFPELAQCKWGKPPNSDFSLRRRRIGASLQHSRLSGVSQGLHLGFCVKDSSLGMNQVRKENDKNTTTKLPLILSPMKQPSWVTLNRKPKYKTQTQMHGDSNQLVTQLTKQYLIQRTETKTVTLKIKVLWSKQTLRDEEIGKKLLAILKINITEKYSEI